MEAPFTKAEALLAQAFGQDAGFRDGQWEAIQPILSPGTRELVVQRTGWGKSLVYFLATKLLRDAGGGPTLLVSPLLSLMRNQTELASRFGVNAVAINSTNREDWDSIAHELESDRLDLLLVSPERLSNPDFKGNLLPWLEQKTRLLVIDEAHCISDWGHDFRPDYRRILETVNRLNPNASILATTATANDRVIADIQSQLGEDLKVQRGPLMRDSLRLRAQILPDQAERLAWLAQFIPKLEGSGIVYTLTVHDAKRVAEWLQGQGIVAVAYFASAPTELRIEMESKFQRNEIKVLVATTALGMGYDKSDVAFVIHYQRPSSVISYYQQIGRAGRALNRAEVVLLEGSEDDEVNEYFIDSAFPGAEVFEEIQAVLGQRLPTIDAVTARTNRRRSQVEKALKLLEVDGAIDHDKEGYQWRDPAWTYSRLRSEEISKQRRQELDQMRDFAATRECRMLFLANALDDVADQPCGRCDNCCNLRHPVASRELVLQAIEFLGRARQAIISPAFFPPGFADAERKRKIPEEDRHRPGVALSIYNDGAWGKLVRQGKYEADSFSQDLLTPSVQAISQLETQPDWLTWVPSMRTRAVEKFALELARALGIPAIPALIKTHENEPQKSMQNATHQLDNVWNSFEVAPGQTLDGVCLLVDDIVDSGWTLAALGMKLKKAGAKDVIPFALATARPRGDS